MNKEFIWLLACATVYGVLVSSVTKDIPSFIFVTGIMFVVALLGENELWYRSSLRRLKNFDRLSDARFKDAKQDYVERLQKEIGKKTQGRKRRGDLEDEK